MKPHLINPDTIHRITKGIHRGKQRSAIHQSKRINFLIIVFLVLGAAFLYHRYLHRTSPEQKRLNLTSWINNIQNSYQQQQLEAYQQYLKQHQNTMLGSSQSTNTPFQQQIRQMAGRHLLPSQQRAKGALFGRNGRNIPAYKLYR